MNVDPATRSIADVRTPIWSPPPLSIPRDTRIDSLPQQATVVVVGAGIAGLATALELGRYNVDTLVVTAGRVGEGVTGKSNAKVTSLHQRVYADIEDRHGAGVAAAYAQANQEAVGWLREVAGSEVWQARDAVTIARSDEERTDLEREEAAARRAGLAVSTEPSEDWPGAHGALRLTNQGQVDPVQLLNRMIRIMPPSVRVVEHARVVNVRPRSSGQEVRVGEQRVRAEHVVVATGLPVLDRGGYFALCEPESSYLIALAHPGEGGDMLITAGEPKVSIRWVPGASPADRVVLVGGQSHRTGAGAPTTARYAALEQWARTNLDGVGNVLARWSALDFMSPDRLPFAGPLNRVGSRLQVITGLSKWGFTLGAAAAATVTRHITGQPSTDFDRAVHPRRLPDAHGAATIAQSNIDVARHMTEGWASALTTAIPDLQLDGQGTTGRVGPHVRASCRVQGVTHTVGAVCPHLGGIVSWNDGDQTWDCPLHGSRFSHTGAVRHGPANRPLSSDD